MGLGARGERKTPIRLRIGRGEQGVRCDTLGEMQLPCKFQVRPNCASGPVLASASAIGRKTQAIGGHRAADALSQKAFCVLGCSDSRFIAVCYHNVICEMADGSWWLERSGTANTAGVRFRFGSGKPEPHQITEYGKNVLWGREKILSGGGL